MSMGRNECWAEIPRQVLSTSRRHGRGTRWSLHFHRIRLNRDYAISDDAIVERALDPDMSVKMKDGGKTVRWHLDLERGVATSERPGDHLKQFAVLVRPMLGCVATAPGFASAPPP